MAKEDIKENKVYEASFHIAPNITEDNVANIAKDITSKISGFGGEIIADGAPIMKTLAYSISKTVKSEKSNYNRAYFGWVKFALDPDSVLKVKEMFDTDEHILRYLIISTVRESTLVADREKRSPANKTEEESDTKTQSDTKKDKKTDAKTKADVDKAIDELVIN